MSQHQTPSGSKTTKHTHKDKTPSMDFLDDEILDVVPLFVIPGEAPDSNHPKDVSASACPTQGNNSSIPSSSTHATSSKEDMHHTDRVIRNLVTKILTGGHSVKGVSTPLSRMYPSPEVEPHSEKDDDSSRFEKDMADEVDVKKRKVGEVSESDEDVKEDVLDISPVKRTTVRKSPVKVVVVHLDNISFHREDGAAKWKFVIQRRVVVERELGKDVVEVKEVMDLIKNVGLMKTVAGLSQCYEGLVKEFIVNIPEDIAHKNSKEFCKVFVRGKCITFSPTVINKFLGRGIEGACELEATDNEVCREITESHVKDIVMTSAVKKPASKGGLIVELKEVCKELDVGIRVAIARKESLDAMIASLEQVEGENTKQAKEAEAQTSSQRSATKDDTSGNSVSDADEDANSSSYD
ncbi:uncharacterized protein LOC127102276 [Lathyrus oleraceus]|uniref:uncharacterized protein LOC127102276 n=1 Tax=Pisum sativum TaxID=3888 RepID=UPI0021D259A6|nr:uncharacterized protein LOC127102276 [Pisum sativum]